MAAFRHAAAAGADYLELDVQRTADDELVVIHDDDLARTTDGVGLVATTTWRGLETLDAGAWFGPAFAGERVPRLASVLAWATDEPGAAGLGLLVEAKGAGTGDPIARAISRIFGPVAFGDLLVLAVRAACGPGGGAEPVHDADRRSRPAGRRPGRGGARVRRHDGQCPVVMARAG